MELLSAFVAHLVIQPGRVLAWAVSAAIGAALACSPSDEPNPVASGVSREYVEAFGENMVTCMSAKGWNVAVDPEDGAVYNVDPIPQGQGVLYESDFEDCVEQFGYDQPILWTREEAEAYYDALVDAAECVRGLGYSVPEQPSRQTVVENLMSGRLPGWDPYEEVTRNPESIAEINRVFAECPQPS